MKLKVVHLNAASAGGAYTAAQRLVDALNSSDVEIDASHWVFEGGRGHKPSWANTKLKRLIAFGLHAIEKLDFLRFEKNKSVRFAFSHAKTGIDVTQWAVVQDADIIHLHWVNKGFLSFSSFEKLLSLGKPIVWTCHDLWPFTGGCYWGCSNISAGCGNCGMLKNPGINDLSKKVFTHKEILWGVDSLILEKLGTKMQFVFPSVWLMNEARKSVIALNKSLINIPNAIDTEFFKPALNEDINLIRSKNGFDEKRFLILFAAANISDERKGFADFLKIINQLNPLDIQVAVVGRNDKFHGDLPAHVKLLGYHSEKIKMKQFFQMADFYITTAKEENLPTTIIESLSCGTPVGAYSVGGIPQMIENGGNGYLVEKDNWMGLVEKLKDIIGNREEKHRGFRERCREFAVANYSESSVVQKYSDIYQKLTH